MGQGEVGHLARTSAAAGLCPITEANPGDSIFPAKDFVNAGGRFDIGTDSNILIDAAGELWTLKYAQRLALRSRNVLAGLLNPSTGATLFKGAVEEGGPARGVATGIAAGASADFLELDRNAAVVASREQDALIES